MSRNLLSVEEKLAKAAQRERESKREGTWQGDRNGDYGYSYPNDISRSYTQAPNGQSYYAASAEEAYLIGRAWTKAGLRPRPGWLIEMHR